MKCYKRVIDGKTGTGFVKLEAQDVEDMWHVYVLLFVNPVSADAGRRGVAFFIATTLVY